MAQRRGAYNTGQRKAILEYMQCLGGAHTTAKEIMRHLKESGIPVGLTTVYRHMDKLVEDGSAKRYSLDESSGACFQYCPEPEELPMHFHLKCEGCGKLIHLKCDFLDELQEHVMDDHGFSINQQKTVFYGVCADCAK